MGAERTDVAVLDDEGAEHGRAARDGQRSARAVWAVVATAVALQATTILRGNWAWLVGQLPDDAFYYLEIARHLGAGDGATFDGINQTNGFHPLWQFLLVPLAVLLPGDAALVRAAMLLGLALGVAGVAIVARFLRPAVGAGAAAMGALVVVHGAGATWWLRNGMESSVVVLTLSLLLVALGRFDRSRDRRSALLVGFACGAVVLARMDFAVVLAVVPVVLALRVRQWWPGVRWAIGAAVVAGPVLLWEVVSFGHLLSVSGTVKLADTTHAADEQWGGLLTTGYLAHVGRASVDFVRSVTQDLGGSTAGSGGGPLGGLVGHLFVVLGVVGCVLLVRRRRREGGTGVFAGVGRADAAEANGVAFAVATVIGVVVAKTVIDLVLLPAWASAWYSAPMRVAVGMALGIGTWELVTTAARVGGRRALALAGAAVLLLALPLGAWDRSAPSVERDESWQQTLDLAADWVVAEGPDGRYGAFDAGLLGYRLDGERKVVNLDGLVNDYEYARLLRERPDIRTLVAHEDIDLLVNRLSEAERDELDCARPLWRSPEPVPYGGTTAYVYGLDVRRCR